jgi:hypothetical protein
VCQSNNLLLKAKETQRVVPGAGTRTQVAAAAAAGWRLLLLHTKPLWEPQQRESKVKLG